jgi:tetratricopeptide (TPR) repeat protein
VEYYKQLPPEARTTETKRNSALAQARYASVLTSQGKSDEAKTLTDEAGATMKALRDGGDTSDDTLIAEARVNIVVADNFSNRNDQISAIKVVNEALEKLKPVLAKANPSPRARKVEASASAYLGFSLLRTGRPAAAIEPYQRTRAIAKEFGALELTDLTATSGYIVAGWQLGEALGTIGKIDEAKTVLNETIALADKLIAVRPGHRRALGAKATAFSQLAQIEGNQLQIAGLLRYARESQKVQQEVTALDPGSSGSQNNLRVGHVLISTALFSLGRVDEAWQAGLLTLTTGKDERVNGFSAQNLLSWHAEAAVVAASMGDMNRAKQDISAAERYFSVIKATGASEGARAYGRGRIETARGEIALMTRGDLAGARIVIEQSIAERVARVVGKPSAIGAGLFAAQHGMAAQLSMALGEYTAAEAHLRKALSYHQFNETPSLGDQAGINDTRALLAMTLARQDKREEAVKVLAPALAYYRLPVVQKSDDQTLKVYGARVLLAAALANPAERAKYLAEAAQRFDSMPPPLKRLKNFAMIREEIGREMQK